MSIGLPLLDCTTQQNILAAWNLMMQAQTITLLTHYKPDGDGISACAALSLVLKKYGKTINAVYPCEPEFTYKRHPENVTIATHSVTPDLLIACDTANYDRLYFPDAFKNIPLINIDHHVSNSINGAHNFVNAQASSTCELLYALIEQWAPEKIDPDIAQALLFGILYDTQVFHIASTSALSLKIAAQLIEHGAVMGELKEELLANKNPKIIALWRDAMNNISFSSNGTSVWTFVTQADLKRHDLELSGLVGFNNFLAEISGIDVTLLFYETQDGKTKVSLRSRVTDVNQIAQKFGGGGHKKASGILSSISMQELIKQITALL